MEVRELVAGSFLEGRARPPRLVADGAGPRRAEAKRCAPWLARPRRGRATGLLAPARRPRVHPPRLRHGRDGDARVRHAGRRATRSRSCPRAGARACAACRSTARAAERVEAGHRAAVNLSGLDVQDLARGRRPSPGRGRCAPRRSLDAELTLLPGERALQGPGARACPPRERRSAGPRPRPGRPRRPPPGPPRACSCASSRPSVAGRGDRLVLRSYSPAATIGGAVVVDPLAGKRRRGQRVVDSRRGRRGGGGGADGRGGGNGGARRGHPGRARHRAPARRSSPP